MLLCLVLGWLWLQLCFFDLWSSIASGVISLLRRGKNDETEDKLKEEELLHRKRIHTLLRKKYEALGNIRFNNNKNLCKKFYLPNNMTLKFPSFGEWSTLFWFCAMVALWIFREPKFMPGWGEFFSSGYVKDSSVAMFIAVILFMWPRDRPKLDGLSFVTFIRKMIDNFLIFHENMVLQRPWLLGL